MTERIKSLSKNPEGNTTDVELIKKLLIIELFKLGVPQVEIGKKLKINTGAVNSFLKGVKKPQQQEV